MTDISPPRATDYLTNPRYQGIASEMGYEQDHRTRLQKVKYTHDAMIDLMIAQPDISQNQLASQFGYSVPWISRVMGSDSFQARLAQRRDELIDPVLIEGITERLQGLATQSLEVITTKLAATQSADLALKGLELATKALGFGMRERNVGPTTNNFVVHLPSKSASAESWGEDHTPENLKALPPKIIENFSTTTHRDPTEQPAPMSLAEGQDDGN